MLLAIRVFETDLAGRCNGSKVLSRNRSYLFSEFNLAAKSNYERKRCTPTCMQKHIHAKACS